MTYNEDDIANLRGVAEGLAEENERLREQLVTARNDAIQECIDVCNEFSDTSPTFVASKLFDMTLTDDQRSEK